MNKSDYTCDEPKYGLCQFCSIRLPYEVAQRCCMDCFYKLMPDCPNPFEEYHLPKSKAEKRLDELERRLDNLEDEFRDYL